MPLPRRPVFLPLLPQLLMADGFHRKRGKFKPLQKPPEVVAAPSWLPDTEEPTAALIMHDNPDQCALD
jgi:hypothetical protein